MRLLLHNTRLGSAFQRVLRLLGSCRGRERPNHSIRNELQATQ
jgi:hypothetical protein